MPLLLDTQHGHAVDWRADEENDGFTHRQKKLHGPIIHRAFIHLKLRHLRVAYGMQMDKTLGRRHPYRAR